LDIGQEIKVPLTAENFSQDGKKSVSESLVPVYHVVQEKEWLYRISVNHNKVPIPVLEKWNRVTGDQVHAGLPLIVGYLKVRTALSALAKNRMAPAVAKEAAHPAREGGSEKGDDGLEKRSLTATGTAEKDSAGLEGRAESSAGSAGSAGSAVTTQRSVGSAGSASPVTSQGVAAGTRPALSQGVAAPRFDGGRFRADFNDNGHSVTGQAGIFKSMSGWQDGKYYALINNVAIGTIVKITDQSNGKSVFAKVLGQLPDMKESIGLTIRLSNAAAAELGEGEGRFGVGVSY
jgi:hypothetical protein